MKKFGFLVVPFVVSMVLVAGCDYIRASLGKPTSADLVKISDELKAREQYLRDSVAAVRAAEAAVESSTEVPAAVPAAVPASVPTVIPAVSAPAPAPAPAATASLKKYYAVAGAFKNPEGAQKFVDKLQEKGFEVQLLDFKSGLTVVCIAGSDSLEEAKAGVAELRKLGLSSSDPWIYNTNQKLHKSI